MSTFKVNSSKFQRPILLHTASFRPNSISHLTAQDVADDLVDAADNADGASSIEQSKDFSDNYEISKLIMYSRLKKRINNLKTSSEKTKGPIFSFSYFTNLVSIKAAVTDVQQEKETVSSYWNEQKTKTNNIIFAGKDGTGKKQLQEVEEHEHANKDDPRRRTAVVVICAVLWIWFELARMRKRKKIKGSVNDKTILVQTTVRRWLARKEVHDRMATKQVELDTYKKLVADLTGEGVQIGVFSKTSGKLVNRKLRLDSAHEHIIFEGSAKSKIRLNAIHAIEQHQSDTQYKVMASSPACCFHICILGGDIVDFHAKDRDQAQALFKGFSRLILLLFSQSPFYIDQQGTPRRALKSVIDRALEKKGPTRMLNLFKLISPRKGTVAAATASSGPGSKVNSSHDNNDSNLTFVSIADEMRYRAALKMLLGEYNVWDDELSAEEWKYNVANNIDADNEQSTNPLIHNRQLSSKKLSSRQTKFKYLRRELFRGFSKLVSERDSKRFEEDTDDEEEEGQEEDGESSQNSSDNMNLNIRPRSQLMRKKKDKSLVRRVGKNTKIDSGGSGDNSSNLLRGNDSTSSQSRLAFLNDDVSAATGGSGARPQLSPRTNNKDIVGFRASSETTHSSLVHESDDDEDDDDEEEDEHEVESKNEGLVKHQGGVTGGLTSKYQYVSRNRMKNGHSDVTTASSEMRNYILRASKPESRIDADDEETSEIIQQLAQKPFYY